MAMGRSSVYEEIGRRYGVTRRPDPRIARAIDAALGDARSVVNVGAGAGSYEPYHLRVTAVEPSPAMIRQRAPGTAPVVRAVAEHLPFADASFDAALAVLTLHHWTDRAGGLAELARVARRRVVILTWDPSCRDLFWLTTEYLPAIVDHDLPRFPRLPDIARCFKAMDAHPVLVPHDCVDGFLGAFWRRPDAYLDPGVRRGISTFGLLSSGAVDEGLARLAADLEEGRGDARFGDLRTRDNADLGYRLLVAEPRR